MTLIVGFGVVAHYDAVELGETRVQAQKCGDCLAGPIAVGHVGDGLDCRALQNQLDLGPGGDVLPPHPLALREHEKPVADPHVLHGVV
jgi:hypothetical protein